MTLLEFIEKVKMENNIQTSIKDLEALIYKKAKEEAGRSNSVSIDDETVKNWILNYEELASDEEKKAAELRKKREAEKAEFDAEQAMKKAQREAEARAKAEAEEKAKREKEGQLSLWDL